MKLALLIERMDPARGGREASTAQIATELARRAHEVTVLCQLGSLRSDGIDVIELGRAGRSHSARLSRFLASARAATQAEPFDIVHAMLPADFADVYQPRGGTAPARAETARLRRGPLGRLLHRIGDCFNRRRRLQACNERHVAASRDVWIAPNSPMVTREFERFYDRRDRVRVIFNGVAVPPRDAAAEARWRQHLRTHWAIPADELILLCPAANYRLKGVAEAITALARWREARPDAPPLHMVFLGDRREDPFRRLADRMGVSRWVHFAEPAEDIWPCYAAADGALLLSWYDACSRVILEAVGCSLPAITTARNGAADLLADGAGWVIDAPDDAEGLLAALDEFVDPVRRGRAASACGDRAGEITIDRHVTQLEELYRDILAERDKEPAS